MDRPIGAIRYKASHLGLRARGTSEAWKQKEAEHGKKLLGRKRPDQAEVMKAMYADGRLSREVSPERRAAISVRAREQIKKNGHPRGALGMKHTAETKKVLGEKSKANWDRMSVEERDDAILKQAQGRRAVGGRPPARGSWKAGWREIGGQRCFFRSRWEANYARYLEWLKSLGEIESWEHEPHTFWFKGIKRGVVSYLPDFRVVNKGGAVQWHEVKGWMDSRSKTTIKRMAKYHPKELLIVIQEKQYREIKRKVSTLVNGWEE